MNIVKVIMYVFLIITTCNAYFQNQTKKLSVLPALKTNNYNRLEHSRQMASEKELMTE